MADEERLAELLLQWEEAWQQGQDPPVEELCAGCPDLAVPLRQKTEALKRMDWMNRECETSTTNPPADQQDQDELPRGTVLVERYRIDNSIGQGGFGHVYRAFDDELQREIAVKISRSHGPNDSLVEEARRVAQLRHPGIVTIHDVGRHEGRCFFVADFIDGTNLAEKTASERLSPDESVPLVAKVAEALHSAHEQGFIHRDIKPANILIDRFGRPLIADFGIATTAQELGDGDGATSGTLPYMAPEQVAGEVQLIDARTDIYALGVVLYELLTGELPYKGRTPVALREQILFKTPGPIRAKNPKVSADLGRLCLSCLSKHPADRPKNANALSESLWACLQTQHRQHVSRILILLLTAVISLAAVGLGIGFFGDSIWKTQPPSESKIDAPSASSISQDGALVFDGETRIITPLKSFAPVTLEAWVLTQHYNSESQFFIGSDIPTKFGLGIAVNEAVLSAEYVEGMINSSHAVPLRQWSHVAVVFGQKETRLYLNGRCVDVGPATQPPKDVPFVIGNVGMDNPIAYFQGRMRCVRISEGERYGAEDFTPEERFEADPTNVPRKAILIYDGQHVEDDKILDLSGHGNHGYVDRLPARWPVVPQPTSAVEYQGHKYQYVGAPRISWSDAKRACEKAGGHLVCMETEAEVNFVQDLSDGLVWVGFRQEEDGQWRWLTGGVIPAKKIRFLLPGRQYGVLLFGGQLHARTESGCDTDISKNQYPIRGFVCEWEPETSARPESEAAPHSTPQPDPEVTHKLRAAD